MTVKAWILRSARLRCPHCGGTVYMQYKGRWSIRKAFSAVSGNLEAETSNPSAAARGAKTSSTARTHGEAVDDSATPQSPSLSLPDNAPERDEEEDATDG